VQRAISLDAPSDLRVLLYRRFMVRVAEEIARRGSAIASFGIESRRSATEYPEPSLDINRRVGDIIREATGLTVDLSAPDLLVRIAVVQGSAYVYAQRVEGPGGLPVGTSGKVIALLSAGIDSPVAAWLCSALSHSMLHPTSGCSSTAGSW